MGTGETASGHCRRHHLDNGRFEEFTSRNISRNVERARERECGIMACVASVRARVHLYWYRA